MIKIYLFLIIFCPYGLLIAQNTFSASKHSPVLDHIQEAKYIGDGKIAVINDGEVYEINIDDDNNYAIDYITNSGVDLTDLEAYDVDRDGRKDLLTWDRSYNSVYTYLNDSNGFESTSNFLNTKIRSFTTQDYDGDNVDELIINGFIYSHNEDGTLTKLTRVNPSNPYIYKSPYLIDMDEDGDLDIIYNLVTNLGYLENTGTDLFKTKLINKFNHGCEWMKVIETTDGPKILYSSNNKNIQLITPTVDYPTKMLITNIPASGYHPYIMDIDNDGTEEVIFKAAYLNDIYIFHYDVTEETGTLKHYDFNGIRDVILIDDMEEPKIAGITSNGLNIYGFDNQKDLYLIKSTQLSINGAKQFVDIDGDGFVDILSSTRKIRYLGDGNFGTIADYIIPGLGGKYKDFDNDGDVDYVSDEVWYENIGQGLFGPEQANPNYNPYPDPEVFFTSIIYEGDIDEDGDIDLLLYNNFGEDLELRENDDNISFKDDVLLAESDLISGDLISIDILDLDLDGEKDILMAAETGVVWFKGTGNLQFNPGIKLQNNTESILSIDMADGNNDGYLDIVVGTRYYSAGSTYGNTILYLGSSTGPLNGTTLGDHNNYKRVLFGDADGTGDLDIIVGAGKKLYAIEITDYNDLTSPTIRTLKDGFDDYGSFKVMDVDGDNDEDIIIYDKNGVNLEYLLNNETSVNTECPHASLFVRNKSQQELYSKRFGGCEVIDGSLIFSSGGNTWSDIENFETFSNLEEIKGDLSISYVNGNSDYNGFNNLKRIGGDLYINQHKTDNLRGFDSLHTISGDFVMNNGFHSSNKDERNFDDLTQLDTLGGGIIISYSDITNIDKLLIRNKIGGDLKINQCPSLESLTKLQEIDSVVGNIDLFLHNISDLNSLKNIRYFEGMNIRSLDNSLQEVTINPMMDSVKNDLIISVPTINQTNKIRYVGGDLNLSAGIIGEWNHLTNVGERLTLRTDSLSEFSFKELTNVNSYFFCQFNYPTDLQNFNKLKTVGDLSLSSLTIRSLDGLQALDSIRNSLNLASNYQLTDITALSDSLYLNGLGIYSNPKLSLCDIPAFCNYLELEGAEAFIHSNAAGCLSKNDLTCLSNSVVGYTFYDYNKNGIKDSTDAPLANITLSVPLSLYTSDSLITTHDGSYRKFLSQGDDFTIDCKLPENWEFTTPNKYVIDSFIPEVTGLEIRDFGLIPNEETEGFTTAITAGLFVCNRAFEVSILTKNIGTEKSSGYYKISYSDKLTLSPDYTGYSSHDEANHIITIEYEDIYPYFTESFNIPFIAPTADEINNTDINISLDIVESNELQVENIIHSDILNLPLLCSFDPNDKLVTSTDHTGNIRLDNEEDELLYTIRFQNTGNFYAQDIRVTDEISENLDLSTFEFIDASHDVQITIRERIVSFFFKDIYLTDSTSSFIESQGYVSFKIKPMNSSLNEESFTNMAEIYFDFNEPIITNEVASIVYDPSPTVDYKKDIAVNIYPQPARDYMIIDFPDKSTNLWKYSIHNTLGMKIASGDLIHGKINTGNIESGIYNISFYHQEKNIGISRMIAIMK